MSTLSPKPEWLEAGMQAAQMSRTLLTESNSSMRQTQRIEERGRETKILADEKLHDCIVSALQPTGLPIYSEEGDTTHPQKDTWCWVIDPLDGSANFQRGFSLCASSIALCYGMQPQAGFVYDLHTKTIVSGGIGIPRAKELQGAAPATLDRAILCTGIPARLEWSDQNTRIFSTMFRSFYKIRMLGSAVQALLHVACGKADVYYERNIMFWDVAAAWAIAEAAGIQIYVTSGSRPGSLQVLAAAPELLETCRELFFPSNAKTLQPT